jgi:hypothetical protein
MRLWVRKGGERLFLGRVVIRTMCRWWKVRRRIRRLLGSGRDR